jgi:hypothetical protein
MLVTHKGGVVPTDFNNLRPASRGTFIYRPGSPSIDQFFSSSSPVGSMFGAGSSIAVLFILTF